MSCDRSCTHVARNLMRRTAIALVVWGGFATPLRAQSLDAGAISGFIRDSLGRALPEATITLTERATGVARARLTPRDGSYGYNLLLPGNYDLLVERFGYRPRLIAGIPVRPGSQIRLDATLAGETSRPAIDTAAYAGVPAGGLHLALDGGRADDQFAALADRAGIITGVGGLLPGSGSDLSSEGLPGRLGVLALDGIARSSARHPRLASAWLDGIAFPIAAVHGVEMLPGGMDAEWSAAGGGALSAFTVPGSRTMTATLTATAGIDGQTGALVVGGPAVRDTAHFAFGIAVARLNPELPAPWSADSLANAAVATARDSFQTDLSAYQRKIKPATTILSGFGRFDWLLARDHRLSVRADVASASLHDPILASDVPVALGAGVKARDVSVAALLTSTVGTRAGSELKLSLDAGSRDYSGAGLVGTVFSEGGFAAGNTDLQPGTFKRISFRLAETGHYRFGFGVLKFGIQVGLNTFDQTFADGRSGTFFFGDSPDFVGRRGAFYQAVGASPIAHFKTTTLAGFLQTLLRPTASLELLAGVRVDKEQLPLADIRLNSEWLRLTGIDNRTVPKTKAAMSPRFGFTWTPDAARRWQIGAEAGRFAEASDPGELAEAITHATGVSARRAFGTLGAWPSLPDSTVAPVRGQALTLLGPQYAPPRTSRLRFGITGNVHGTVVRMQLAYRHTDFLPVRRDLNLPVSTSARDQDGRAVYGTLAKSGTLVGPTPGTNRRFGSFDAVSSLDPSAASDYYGITAAFQRNLGRGISVMATYTYSRTTDNWFGARASGSEAQFLPNIPASGSTPWAKDRSDFDVPHRLVLGTELRFASGRARVAALYRRQSGYAFTPGFRDGVDINGDGSSRNDPAFVSDTLPGAANVVGANTCLRSQVGKFAARNSCREPSIGMFDLRLTFALRGLGRGGAEIFADALGLAATGLDVIDQALYLVDATAPLVTTPAGVTRVPLIANDNFGKPLAKRDPGATFRLGLRIGF